MEYKNKEEIKEKAIEYYLNGKTLIEISKILNCSRNYLGTLIKTDDRVKKFRNSKKAKVSKLKNRKIISTSIPTSYWGKIGVSSNPKVQDFVDITVDEDKKEIIIKKHK